MLKTYTCILCPNGCEIEVTTGADPAALQISGNLCPRGADYVRQELTAPMRNIATSVLVDGGELPLCSVRLSAPIPKDRIFDVMAEIRRRRLQAPVQIGQIVIKDILGLGSDVIATRNVLKK